MFKRLLLGAALLCAGTAQAALINFTGNIANHNDVIRIDFTLLSDANNVRVWTDSHDGGVNFDPITALWDAAGNLLDENDDNDSIDPATQTVFDSGFTLPFLAAGNYTFTIATFNNFAAGSTLADGFSFDSETAIPLSQWCQPANDCNEGTFWSVWLDGVDSATNPGGGTPVPAPATLLLMAFGGLLMARRRK
ncbi:PEP-CTERM sorting domain-containing protein [Aestuariibacter halophilus]|uniref:PEP-CTERM sorting domain-containing protein n=1 Tax=Fluctibacter halophilus TaxID=226011 RepID=A0ABS8G9N9_9ALTE|nr:DVUA0089 family protein [Aestuariibacter halophilus]MCC2616434.1 PEP-CTERM sorting domain-containing protein [Aestuariibacter halophilus]